MSTLSALSRDLADAVEHVGQSVVAIHARRRIPSSGVLWRPGVIVAANHTIQHDENITVSLAGGRTTQATLAGRDPSTDVAVLRVEETPVPAVERGTDADLQVGRLVLALGRPGLGITASLGIVSAAGGEWRTWQGGKVDRFVRLDLSIYDGFSGGPLVEAGGKVLGVNTSGLSRAVALTLPSATVDRVAEQLLTAGRVQRGYLGLAVQPVRLPSGGLGLVIVNLEASGAAHSAGLLLGDIITGLDERDVDDPADLLAALGPERVGQPLRAQILRAGEPRTVTVTVGERPASRGRAAGRGHDADA
jgi:S1-C subfamily serine protease